MSKCQCSTIQVKRSDVLEWCTDTMQRINQAREARKKATIEQHAKELSAPMWWRKAKQVTEKEALDDLLTIMSSRSYLNWPFQSQRYYNADFLHGNQFERCGQILNAINRIGAEFVNLTIDDINTIR